jgi:hypothetical protein
MVSGGGGSIIVLIEKTVNGVWWVDIVLIWSDREQDKGDILCPGAPLGPPPMIMTVRREEGGGGIAGEDQSAGVLDSNGRTLVVTRHQVFCCKIRCCYVTVDFATAAS